MMMITVLKMIVILLEIILMMIVLIKNSINDDFGNKYNMIIDII